MQRIILRAVTGGLIAFSTAACSTWDIVAPPVVSVAPTVDASAVPRVSGPVLRSDRLASLLLTAEELPAGYTAQTAPTGTGGELGSLTDLGAGIQECGRASAPDSATAGGPAANAAQLMFQKGPSGPFVLEAIVSTSDDAARMAVTALVKAPEVCPNFSGRPPNQDMEVTVSLSQMTVPPLGDAAAGAQLLATVAGLPIGVRGKVVAVAHHGIALTIVVMGLTEPTKEEVEKITTAAFEKIRAAT